MSAKVVEAKIDGQIAPLKIVRKADTHYMGVACAMPVMTGLLPIVFPVGHFNKGTLLGVYGCTL